MRLLIVTQAVDRNDSNLGFFHRWIEEFAKHCERVIVICLREGEHRLPDNVEVLSLGKEKGTSRLVRVIRFYRYIISRRREYDAVFVHMNPEYIVLGGALWWFWYKKIVLWYTHKNVDLKLRVATFFANDIATASKESFRLATNKLVVIGHGIDTDFFSPVPHRPNPTHIKVLSAGRLSASKRHDIAIRAVALMPYASLAIAGGAITPRDRECEKALYALVNELAVQSRVTFLGNKTQEQMRVIYRNADVLIHTSETGSIDKVVLEALATGVAVVTTSNAYAGYPVQTVLATPEAIADACKNIRATSDRESIIREKHSLKNLIPRILSLFGT